MINKIILSSLLILGFVQLNSQTTFGLKIQEISNDGSNYIISLQMQMMGDSPEDFQLGSSSLQFTFPNNALSNPIIQSTTLTSPFPYFVPSVTVPLIDQCSFNIELASPDGGATIATAPAWTELGQINFTIDNAAQMVPLTWSYNGGTTQTVVYLDDEIVQIFAENPNEDFLLFEPLQASSNPVFTFIPSDITFECGELIPIEMAIATTDNLECEDVTVTFSDDDLQSDCGLIITRTFTATDECGNSSNTTQVITVVDTTAPEFTSPPTNAVYQCMEEVPELEDIAVDDCNTITVESNEVTNGVCPITIIRTWTATDGCGNSTQHVQTISVEDTIIPDFVTFPEDLTLSCDDDVPAVIDPTFSDNCDGNVTMTMSEETTGECPLEMSITRTWTLTDNCGNENSQSQTISFSNTDNMISSTNFYFSTNLYPNPTSYNSTLVIKSSNSDEVTISIYNILGELMFETQENILAGQSENILELSKYKSGLYLIKISNNSVTEYQAIVKK